MTQHEHKTFSGFEVKDEALGVVEAIIATVGVVDFDRDVIMPGAIKDGSTVKLSSYAHDVITSGAPPVGLGKVSVIGHQAILKGQFFLNTQRGREAFETVKALGKHGEWSTGFRVTRTAPMTQEWREKGAERLIAEMLLVEGSPVFAGASPGTATLAVKSQDEQRELAAIAQAIEQRELQMLKLFSETIGPARADHLVPPLVKERLADVADYACKYLGIESLDVHYYEPQPGDTRLGFYKKSRPNVVFVAVGRGEEMAMTIAHEAAHAAGYVTEAAAEQSAENIIKCWEERRPRMTPYGFPLRTYDQEPTVGSCGMFPPTGGW